MTQLFSSWHGKDAIVTSPFKVGGPLATVEMFNGSGMNSDNVLWSSIARYSLVRGPVGEVRIWKHEGLKMPQKQSKWGGVSPLTQM